MKRIKVLIVDDHRIVREGLKLFLEEETQIQVVGEAESLQEMLRFLETHKIDVLLIDFKLRDGDGINGALKVMTLYPNVKTILITAYLEPEIIHSALYSNIHAIIFKNIDEEDLVATIIDVFEGHYNPIDHLPKRYFKETSSVQWVDFTDRERAILDWLALGKTNIEIASQLNLAEKTVRNYIYNLFKKINVSNRTEAASYWIKSKMTNRDK